MATMPIGFRKAPPKASLLSLSPMGGGGALDSKTSSDDAAKVSSLVDVDVIYMLLCQSLCFMQSLSN
jgi:hypothetical protein